MGKKKSIVHKISRKIANINKNSIKNSNNLTKLYDQTVAKNIKNNKNANSFLKTLNSKKNITKTFDKIPHHQKNPVKMVIDDNDTTSNLFNNRLETIDNINKNTVDFSNDIIMNEDVNILRNINPSHDVKLGNELNKIINNPLENNDLKSRFPNVLSDHVLNKEVKDIMIPNISNELNNMNHLNVMQNEETLFPETSSIQIIQNEILKGNIKKDEDIIKLIQNLKTNSIINTNDVVNTSTSGFFTNTKNSIKNIATNVGNNVKSTLTFAKDATVGTLKTVAGAIIPGPQTALIAAGLVAGGAALAYGGYSYISNLAKNTIKQINTTDATIPEKLNAKQDFDKLDLKNKHYEKQKIKERTRGYKLKSNLPLSKSLQSEIVVDNSKILSNNDIKKEEITKIINDLDKQQENKNIEKIEVTIEKVENKIEEVINPRLPTGIANMSSKLASYIAESDKIRQETIKLEQEKKNILDVLPQNASGDAIVKQEHMNKINEIIEIGKKMDVECEAETQLCNIKNVNKEKFDKIVNDEGFKKYFIYDANNNTISINMKNVYSKEEQADRMKIDFMFVINECGLMFDKSTGLFYSTEKTNFEKIPISFSLLSESQSNYTNSKLRRYRYTKFGFDTAQMIIAYNKGLDSKEINESGTRTRFKDWDDLWRYIWSLNGWFPTSVITGLTFGLIGKFSALGLSFSLGGAIGISLVTIISFIYNLLKSDSNYLNEINELNKELDYYYSFINNSQYQLNIKYDNHGNKKAEYDLGFAIQTKKIELKDLSDSNIKDILIDYRNEELNKYSNKNDGIKELLLFNDKIKEAERMKEEYLNKYKNNSYLNDSKFIKLVEESNKIDLINEKMSNLLQTETKFTTSKENIEAIKEYLTIKWGLYDTENTLQSNQISSFGKNLEINTDSLTREEKNKLFNSIGNTNFSMQTSLQNVNGIESQKQKDDLEKKEKILNKKNLR